MKTLTMEVVKPSVAETLSLFRDIRKTGCIFTAGFVKNDNSFRVMNCRTGVKKYVKGGSLKFNPDEKGLLPVFDLKKKEYRFVNLNTIRWLNFDNKHYIFKAE